MEQKREFYSQTFRSLGCLKLWQARHSMVLDFIDQHQILKMLDLGTSESTLLMKVQRGIQISQMTGVDIDDLAISQAMDNLMPQGIQKDFQYSRQYNQVVRLYKGSALIKYPQLKSDQYQLITLVEVIEHIEAKFLPQLNENVFGYLRPKWVWLSTPNSEFNPLFKWQQATKKFRHDDHKFEWTRKEFQEYVNEVCGKYGYKAIITGVGLAKEDEDLDKGFCTQIAIFQRLGDDEAMEVQNVGERLVQAKNESQQPMVPLQLKHEHTNVCWKSNMDHLLNIAMRQLVSECDSKGSLDWHEVTSILRKKNIFKKLKEHNSDWAYDFKIKDYVHEYVLNHPQAQISCSKVGILQFNPKPESNKVTTDITMLDEEFEREMSEWKTFSSEEQQMIEADDKAMNEPGVTIYNYDNSEPLFRRRSARNKKSKSIKSNNSASSSSKNSSQSSEQSLSKKSKKSQDSENSWGSVQLMEQKKRVRIRKRAIGRVRRGAHGERSQNLDNMSHEVVDTNKSLQMNSKRDE